LFLRSSRCCCPQFIPEWPLSGTGRQRCVNWSLPALWRSITGIKLRFRSSCHTLLLGPYWGRFIICV